MKPLPPSDSRPSPNSAEWGVTLIELLIALSLSGILLLGLNGVLGQVYEQWRYHHDRQELLAQGNLAMARISQAVSATWQVLIPLGENPNTAYSESKRPLLALTLDPGLDRDGDGIADADNDGDGLVDEDLPADNNFDGSPGVKGVDDNGDGVVDANLSGPLLISDNDEDGLSGEDEINGVDDDGDGAIDEDSPSLNATVKVKGGKRGRKVVPPPVGTLSCPACLPGQIDNDGDGCCGEDWLDTVVYMVSPDGRQLIERLPNLHPVNGADDTEAPLVETDGSITLTVQRLPAKAPGRAEQLDITLLISGSHAGELSFHTVLLIGGGK